jgi:cold shock CspA family protein
MADLLESLMVDLNKTMEEHVAVVRWFNAEKAYGFVATETGDLFFHAADLVDAQSVTKGARVRYVYGLGKDNKPRAMSMRIVPDEIGGSGYTETETGSVFSFSAERGFGWIRPDRQRGRGARDIFLSRHTVAGQNVKAGDRVSFCVRLSPRGLEAEDVRIL